MKDELVSNSDELERVQRQSVVARTTLDAAVIEIERLRKQVDLLKAEVAAWRQSHPKIASSGYRQIVEEAMAAVDDANALDEQQG